MWLYTIDKCDEFFNASVCHVCKAFGNGITLKKCSGCRLIYYCCEDHQKFHWKKHETLCQAVQHVRDTSAEFSAARGEKERMQLLQREVTSRLDRKLSIHEIQMFKYARMCRFCGEISNDKLKDCEKCYSVSFCEKHASKHKKDACNKYEKAFLSDILFNINIETPDWRLINYIGPSTVEENNNMTAYLQTLSKKMWKYDRDRELWEMEQSKYFTSVLSLYQGMKMLGFDGSKDELVIHIIDANIREVRIVHCFELLLHLFTSVQKLTLVLIGPELKIYRSAEFLRVCLPCVEKGRKFVVVHRDMYYSDYVKDEMTENEKADFIIGFDCRFHEHEIEKKDTEDTWAQSIKAAAEQNAPIILTCHSQFESKLKAKRINSVLGREIPYYRSEENPFASLRLFRDYEFEFEDNSDIEEFDELVYYPVYAENQHLLIYKTLSP